MVNRGKYIGHEPTTSKVSAVGIWGLGDAERLRRIDKYPPPLPPSQVTVFAVDATGDGTIDLSWTAPASDAAITDYSVEYTPSGGSATTVLVGSAATSYQLTGLTNGTEYSVRVAAVSAGGTGAYSAAVAGTPSAGPALLLTAGSGITGSGTFGDPFRHTNPSYTANHWEHTAFQTRPSFQAAVAGTFYCRVHLCEYDGDNIITGQIKVNGVVSASNGPSNQCNFWSAAVAVTAGDSITFEADGTLSDTYKIEYAYLTPQ